MKMDIVSVGEILIDMFPVEIGRKLAEVSAFYPKPGGASANVAVAAARLGMASAFIGKVGNEAFGQVLIRTLADNDVETRGMRVDEEVRTTVVFIAMPDENNAEFIFFRNPGADLCLRADELDMELIKNTRTLHCGSLLLVDEPARSAQYAAVKAAREGGALISFDVNHRPGLWPDKTRALEEIWKMIALADLLKVNERELHLLTGSNDPETGAKELLKRGVSLVAVTLGTEGSFFCNGKHHGMIPPFTVKTVDAIGCGDAFIAGLLSTLVKAPGRLSDLDSQTLSTCFTYANAVGAVTALNRGVIPALPTAVQVDAFIKHYRG
jgi:fructokinase